MKTKHFKLVLQNKFRSNTTLFQTDTVHGLLPAEPLRLPEVSGVSPDPRVHGWSPRHETQQRVVDEQVGGKNSEAPGAVQPSVLQLGKFTKV